MLSRKSWERFPKSSFLAQLWQGDTAHPGKNSPSAWFSKFLKMLSTQTHKFAVDTVNSARGHPASFLFVRFSSRGRIRWCCRCHRSASSIAQLRKSWVCWRHGVVRRGADGYCAVLSNDVEIGVPSRRQVVAAER